MALDDRLFLIFVMYVYVQLLPLVSARDLSRRLYTYASDQGNSLVKDQADLNPYSLVHNDLQTLADDIKQVNSSSLLCSLVISKISTLVINHVFKCVTSHTVC